MLTVIAVAARGTEKGAGREGGREGNTGECSVNMLTVLDVTGRGREGRGGGRRPRGGTR